ncbi:MAG: NADH-quinone oxidoreductase subunit NuoE [Dehalococcoidales bacterium]
MSQVQEKIINNERNRELLVLLKEAQRKDGYLSEKVMSDLAEALEMSKSDVFGVATFYSFLSTKPTGRNVIRICRSLPCYLKNYQAIVESVAGEIGIDPGETTADGRFTFELTNCIGACDKAPAMLINDEVHGNLTPEKISQILKTYK